MKVIFGFNAINPDGMGSAAVTLLSALQDRGIQFQTIHPWEEIQIPRFYDFNPHFISKSKVEQPLNKTFKEMIDYINNDLECTIFSHFGSPNWAAITPYLRNDIKVIVSVHSVTPSALKISLYNQKRTSKFLAVSWEVESRLKKIIPKSDQWKISLVPNSVDVSNHHPKTDFTEKGKKIKIIFLGRLEDNTKGVDKIPKIAALLKKTDLNFSWDLYGYFHGDYEKRYKEQIINSDVEEVLNYKGCLSPTEIPSILPNYDIMVMPSNHEGLPIALLESMASGLTTVSSKLKNVTDKMIIDGENGFLVGKNDIERFAKIIYFASQDPTLRQNIGNKAREKVISSFSLFAQGQNYSNAFAEAIDSNHKMQKIVTLPIPLQSGNYPESIQPHFLALLLPNWFKRILKKYL
jgi:glycosyltransferase involved in cell wall biosynthesis